MATNAIASVHLLVVSREPAVLRPLRTIGESNCWHLETAASGWEALERLQNGAGPNLVLLDLSDGEGDGLHMLRWLRKVRPHLPIILIAPTDDVERKQEGMRLGAQAMLVRPFEEHQLEFLIRRNLDAGSPNVLGDIRSEDVEPMGDGAFFIAASPVMRKLRVQAELLAQAQVPVLIVGESGSGKSAAAQLIHGLSVRAGSKLLKVNCAALPGRLLEEELFGCEKDLEAGCARTRVGKLELCDKGTLLLDEIVEMPLDAQHTLLQVLQNKQLVRLNGEKAIDVDVRILAATSANIEHAVAGKKLREDLYYHLSAFTLHVPPLRQRKEAIPLFLHYFMQQLTKHYGLPARDFSPSVLEACQRYSWPGNLSELERFVKRYLVMPDHESALGQEPVPGGVAEAGSSLPRLIAPATGISGDPLEQAPESLKSLVQGVRIEAERNAIVAALQKTGWNRKAAARMIKVSYRTLLYKIDQYHLRPSTTPGFSEEHGSNGNGNGHGLRSDGTLGR
ncbi:MAG TPA: sigma-54 dependent transcriptional regulator [Terriglobales bacterium]|nr:sigma-54 dependent transcriptional regulator [Terriglobales bacterium]